MPKYLGIDPALAILLDKAPSEELDYGFVMNCLKDYKHPRVKLNHLLKIEALIRVKKGEESKEETGMMSYGSFEKKLL